MYEDTPQELVHDLFSQAVFGAHALGRPVIGTAEVISTVSRRAIAGYHRSMYTGGEHRRLGGGQHHARRLLALLERAERRSAEPRARSRACAAARRGPRRRGCASSARTPSSTTSASARPGSRARTGAASPRRSSTRSSAARRRRGSSRRSARSAAWRTRSTASRRSTPTRGSIGIYVGTREENLAACVEICVEQIADIAARQPPRGRARAREGEPEGPDHALDGVDVEPDEPAWQVGHLRHRAHDVRPHLRRDRRGRHGSGRRARGRAAAARAALRVRRRAGRGPFPGAVERANSALVARAAA